MKCDGVTNDTTALQTAVTTAAGLSARLVIPPGICITNAAVTLPDNIWVQGAGKFGTTIRRKASTNVTSNMFTLSGSTGNVVISDLTLDYNKASQTAGSDTIGTTATTVNGFTLQRARIINSWGRGIAFDYGAGVFPANILIADNDFGNNGTSSTQAGDVSNGDISIAAPVGVRIVNNRADSTAGSFFLAGTGGNSSGVGNLVVSNNVLTNVQGFGIALGGGGPGSAGGSGVTIEGNVMNMSTSRENLVDLAFWSNVVVNGNQMVSGSCSSGCAAIGDAPPSVKVTASNNTIVGNAALGTDSCIVLGGDDQTITGNTCSGAGGSGIVLIGAATGATGSIVSNNIVKDCNKAGSGSHAGIDLFLPNSTFLSGVVISGNHVYDDQATKTQTYGIAMEVNGTNTTGFSNITINGNDVRGNKTAGILNNTNNSASISIHGNPGYDPLTDASLTLTGQTGAIPFTFLYTTPATNGSGMYRASVDVVITHAGTGGTVNACAQGSNGVGGSVAICTGTINTAVLTEGSASGVFYETNAIGVQYETLVSAGGIGGATYTLRIKIEYLGP